MSLKNVLLKNCIKIIQPRLKKHPQTPERRFLIVSTTALGDTLWATPAIESLRTSFPGSYIGVLTSPLGAQILQHNPYISKIHTLDHFSFSLWKRLYEERFDTVLLFHASQRLTLPLCSLLGATRIVGTTQINKGLDCLLTDPIAPSYQHEIERRLKIVEKIGAKTTTEKLSFFLQPEEKLPKKSKTWIAIHPGSKDRFKRWPKENFGELGVALKDKLDCDILITGTQEEIDLMKEVAQQIPGAHLADCSLDLRSFAALIDQVDLLVCNDTGPFHLACALQKPVVGIYSSTDPHLCGGHLAEKALVISKKPTCTPCLKRVCRAPFCFLQIGISEVLDACLRAVR